MMSFPHPHKRKRSKKKTPTTALSYSPESPIPYIQGRTPNEFSKQWGGRRERTALRGKLTYFAERPNLITGLAARRLVELKSRIPQVRSTMARC